MGGFVQSLSSTNRHGVFAIERRPSPQIVSAGTGIAGLVAQLPWGPDDDVIVSPSQADRLLTIAPPGMDRTGSGYMSVTGAGKGWPDIRIARVLGSAATKASATLTASGPTNVIVVTAKYKGIAGNSINCIVEAPSDGDANHFNLRVQVTGASGTTEDFFQNLNYSGTGSDSTPDLSNARLVGSITKSNAGRPTNGTTPMTTGATGTINSARYIGTAGTGDAALAMLENDPAISIVFSDDPGSTDRAAVNTGLKAHAVLKGERIAITNGDSGLSSSAAIAAAALNSSTFVAYADPWYYQADDIDGTVRLVPPSAMLANVACQLSPSTSPAWKDSVVGDMMAAISRLETNRGAIAGSFTQSGICTIIKEETGGFRFEAAVLTVAPADPSRKRFTRMRIGQYIARSITSSLRPKVDAPNVPLNQNAIVTAVDRFLAGLKRNANQDPEGLPHIVDYAIGNVAAANSLNDIANGDFTIPADIQTSSQMERIILSVRFGENVTVQAA